MAKIRISRDDCQARHFEHQTTQPLRLGKLLLTDSWRDHTRRPSIVPDGSQELHRHICTKCEGYRELRKEEEGEENVHTHSETGIYSLKLQTYFSQDVNNGLLFHTPDRYLMGTHML